MSITLSKSDFKVAQSCAAKLYFLKNGYQTSDESNEYLHMLAEGGFIIGKIAQLLYPEGIEIKTDHGTPAAIAQTEALLQQENIILFEPAIYIGDKLIRIDVLIKTGNSFKLIEVKSKSFDSLEYAEDVDKYFKGNNWKTYLEDASFQKMVLAEKFPTATIQTFLLMPDKAKTSSIEGIMRWFTVSYPETKSGFKNAEVQFTGDANQLKDNNFLSEVCIDEYINPLKEGINSNTLKYLKQLTTNEFPKVAISIKCKDCEYTIAHKEHNKSGFDVCWGDLANVQPHLLELGQLGNINRRHNNIINTMIGNGYVSLSDFDANIIEGQYNRPYWQLTKKQEFLLPGIEEEIRTVRYPLHFIDFETIQQPIPLHSGMRPNGKVIFQWSCHTIEKPGSAPIHHCWINEEDSYPNFRFAEALMECLSNSGTILIWSGYEETILNDILQSIGDRQYINPTLENWIRELLTADNNGKTRFVDLNELTNKYYFHPLMGGQTSIKVTFPAVLQAIDSTIAAKYLQPLNLYRKDENGQIINPYLLLPQIDIFGQLLDISNGTGAMIAYQNMMYGQYRNVSEAKARYRDALLLYCQLDTLAMVIIWEHWMNLLKKN